MIFKPLSLTGAYLIEPERLGDERGFFARSFCRREFEKHGLTPAISQCNISYNAQRGTLRGMHYQFPQGEAKLIRCTRGGLWDVIIDLRPDSPTYMRHINVELTEMNRLMLYVPTGFAHGFLTLQDHSEVFYQMSEFYFPENACGVRWNDSAFGIEWPEPVQSISERDASYPDFIA